MKAPPTDTKAVFRQCGTCAQTFAHLLNRAFEHPSPEHERATGLLAGGILREGHQCGMLWGAALAVGAEAYRRSDTPEQAEALALAATQQVVASFLARTNTVNCREITGVNMTTFTGLVRFMIKTLATGMNDSLCFNLAEAWAPEAIAAGEAGLDKPPAELPERPLNCASEVARRLGATAEEAAMVAGFAGGLGLRGHGCGALAAAIWMQSLRWCQAHPGKTPPFFHNPGAKRLLNTVQKQTGGEMACRTISGQFFESVKDHADFIRNGGCAELMDGLVEAGRST